MAGRAPRADEADFLLIPLDEDGRSLFERDAVPADVRRRLARVPSDAHTIKCMTLKDSNHNKLIHRHNSES